MIEKKAKLNKIVGLKKAEFNTLVKQKQINLRSPRLIPTYKVGDEMALTSVLLSSLRLIKEFRHSILSEVNMPKGGKLYLYSEVEFSTEKNSRFDGLLLVVRGGIIRDAAILEVKNGKSLLDANQIERYQKLADKYSIPKLITISNEFVSEASQSPVSAKRIKNVSRFHLPWNYILTIAHILLFKNDSNIEDEDQVEIMNEVVRYIEWEKSGVFGINQMKPGWPSTVKSISSGASIKISDEAVKETVLSWHQEERDMALILSRELGVLVDSGVSKFKGKLEERLKNDAKSLVETRTLSSTMKVKGAASNITIDANFGRKTIEMTSILIAPKDKSLRGQIGWLKKQLESCEKKSSDSVDKIKKELFIDVTFKNSRNTHRCALNNLSSLAEEFKGREVKEFKIVFVRDLGTNFSKPRNFVTSIEEMIISYYRGIVQHLKKWQAPSPKICDSKQSMQPDDKLEIEPKYSGF